MKYLLTVLSFVLLVGCAPKELSPDKKADMIITILVSAVVIDSVSTIISSELPPFNDNSIISLIIRNVREQTYADYSNVEELTEKIQREYLGQMSFASVDENLRVIKFNLNTSVFTTGLLEDYRLILLKPKNNISKNESKYCMELLNDKETCAPTAKY